jgi:hypothetical protein
VLANCIEGRETNRFGLAGFQDGQILRRDVDGIRQIVQPHFPLRQHYVQIDDDRHKLNGQFLFLPDFSAFIHDPREENNKEAHKNRRGAQVHIIL